MSLHVEETAAEEIDIDEEVENVKKLTSATFAKKKRFKTINLKKSIYVHLFVLPLIATFYFIQSFYNCYTNLSFFSASLPYISYTSQGDYFFQGGLAQIKQALIKQIPLQSNLSDTYISYYRDYFNAHYLTYGSIESFHSYFTDI